ncbi:hypothetical protein CLV78_102281 [Aliiruegeria haliotis]|uniref:Uncharacterized protein n=1 Tax=Aliiruegeria haliotis TaxID=1280846 RepID=A0A2T0RVB7_9RHOB|nr:hypothetical protein [Aliiruegeria haliotis]PRY25104.1 hypothetical protein CLV78_102281 [Aliiruegeria haliotis]
MKQTFTILAFATITSLAGCGSYWNEEAGASLDQGEFGNATMNNQLAHTCRKVTPANLSKYGNPISAGCPGRVQDGKYALFAYQETVESATFTSEITGESVTEGVTE